MQIKLTEEQLQLLKTGNINTFANGTTYYNLPFWYKIDKKGNIELRTKKPIEIFEREVKESIQKLNNDNNSLETKTLERIIDSVRRIVLDYRYEKQIK